MTWTNVYILFFKYFFLSLIDIDITYIDIDNVKALSYIVKFYLLTVSIVSL